MGADVEVRKRRSPLATAFAVGEERLACQESCRVGEWLTFELGLGHRLVEVLDAVESNRDFGVHDGAEHKSAIIAGSGEGVPGPLSPGWVVGQVENRFIDPGDGQIYEAANWTRLVYAGNGLFGSEEDVYNPATFAPVVDAWLAAWQKHHPEQPNG